MNTEAKVGVFVMASVVLIAVTIYFVRAAQTVRGQVEFRTYFQDAGGLEPDAGVLFGGIRVGRITTVHPWSKDATRIEVVFELKPETPVNQKSVARVGTVTLMGSPALLITAGSNDAPRLKAGDVVSSEEASIVGLLHPAVSASARARMTWLTFFIGAPLLVAANAGA